MGIGIKAYIRKLLGEEQYPDLKATLQHLKSWGFSASSVVDVGAYVGEWSSGIRKLFPGSEILMVEPLPAKRQGLEHVAKRLGGRVQIESALLGAEGGTRLRFCEMETGSSVFEEASEFRRSHQEYTTRTLDEVVAEHFPEWQRIDLLKLDVQGYELEVLKGAERVLKQTELILVECSLIPINTGCPLVGDVFEFMSRQGFRLLDICSQVRRKDGALWQTDLLFINQKSQFLPKPRLDRQNW
jgi:FkbM family methyltransferase